mgnify:CR=1 FL=1
MNEKDKVMQICFYLGILVMFVFAFVYFGPSHIDRRREQDARARIVNSEDLNRTIQKSVEDSKGKISGTVRVVGNAETELDRARVAIENCESILEGAKRRTQETGKEAK